MDPPREFQVLRREIESFKGFLQKMEVPSREEEIRKSYLAKLTFLGVLPKAGIEYPSISQGVQEQDLQQALALIKTHPERAKEIVLQILQQFPIQTRDRDVLVETFIHLPYPELEKAIQNLKKDLV